MPNYKTTFGYPDFRNSNTIPVYDIFYLLVLCWVTATPRSPKSSKSREELHHRVQELLAVESGSRLLKFLFACLTCIFVYVYVL